MAIVKVGVAKLGNIASGVMAELLLDERADREDMQTFMATSGTKLEPADVDRVVSNLKAYKPDFCIVVSPNGGSSRPNRCPRTARCSRYPGCHHY